MDLVKKPPPDKAIINRIIESGGRPLPGMVPLSSVPDSEQHSEGEDLRVQDSGDFMEWWLSEEPWKELPGTLHPNTEEDDVKTFTQRAKNLKRALYVFDHLLHKQGAILQRHIKDLQKVADNTEKKVKVAGITGATVGALGLGVAVGSLISTPRTRGASLALATVGVGFAVVGISVIIINKIYTIVDRMMVETVLKVHSAYIEEIKRCVKFIGSNAECLKKSDLSRSKWATRVVRVAEDSVGAIGPLSTSSGLIQGFMLGTNMYFSQKLFEQMKNGAENNFAKQIRVLAKLMQDSLDELMKFRTTVQSADI